MILDNQAARLMQATRRIQVSRYAAWMVVALGALVRLAFLGRQSVWLDEGVSFWTVYRPFGELFQMLSNGFRPLYFLVLYPFASLAQQEWMLRLPSALAGIASVAVIYALGSELFDRRTGVLAALLLAVAPVHAWYSQEARFYALVGFFAITAAWFAARSLRTNRWSDWALFGLFEGLALYTESAALWFVLATNLAGLLLLRYLWREKRLTGWIGAQALALLLYLPGIPALFTAVYGEHTLWIPPATFVELGRVIADLAGGFMRTRLEGLLALAAVTAAFLLGLRAMRAEARRRALPYILLGCWLVVPVLVSFTISQPYYRPALMTALFGQRKSVFLTRNLITVIFPLMLLVARSAMLIGPRRLRIALVAGILLLYSAGVLGNSLVERKEDYRALASVLRQQAEAGDVVIASPGYIEQPVAFYLLTPAPKGLSLINVRDGVVTPAWQQADVSDYARTYPSPLEAVQTSRRVWVVSTENIYQEGTDEALESYLNQEGTLEGAWQAEGVSMRLYQLGAAAANGAAQK